MVGVACRMDHFSVRLPIRCTQAGQTMGQRYVQATWVLAILWAGLASADGVQYPSDATPASIDRSQAAPLARSYVDGLTERERLEVGNAFLQRELERLEAALEREAPGPDLPAALEGIDPEVGGKLALWSKKSRPSKRTGWQSGCPN